MKLFDKFLKILKTDRNTFATYILLMVTIYLIVDRVFEVLLIITNGVAYHYFEPQVYGLAFLAPIFCFLFSFSSSFIKSQMVLCLLYRALYFSCLYAYWMD